MLYGMKPKLSRCLKWTVATVILVGYGLLLWQGPWILDGSHIRSHSLQPADGVVITGVRTMLVAIGAAVVAGMGLIYTHRNHELAREQFLTTQKQFTLAQKQFEHAQDQFAHTQQKDREQANISREAQVTERYVEAIKLLASTDEPEILGGVFSLERIMHDSEKDHATVVKVLSAYIRKRSLDDSAHIGASIDFDASPSPVVQAALDVLRGRPGNREENFPIDLRHAILRNADMRKINLRRARVREAKFAGSGMGESDLRGITAQSACFDQCILSDTRMSMSILQGASFSKARMDGVDLTGSQMARVNLVEATLDGADLTDAFLHQANLSRSVLGGANLRDANMNAAVLHGADLSDALGLTAGQIARAKIDEETVLPSELADHPSIRLMLDRQKHDVSEG